MVTLYTLFDCSKRQVVLDMCDLYAMSSKEFNQAFISVYTCTWSSSIPWHSKGGSTKCCHQ